MLVFLDTPVLAERGLLLLSEEEVGSVLALAADVDDVEVPLFPLLILCSLLPAAVTVCDLLTPAVFLPLPPPPDEEGENEL